MEKYKITNTPYGMWAAWNKLLNELRKLNGQPVREPIENPYSRKRVKD